jgi:hypothetical protein
MIMMRSGNGCMVGHCVDVGKLLRVRGLWVEYTRMIEPRIRRVTVPHVARTTVELTQTSGRPNGGEDTGVGSREICRRLVQVRPELRARAKANVPAGTVGALDISLHSVGHPLKGKVKVGLGGKREEVRVVRAVGFLKGEVKERVFMGWNRVKDSPWT